MAKNLTLPRGRWARWNALGGRGSVLASLHWGRRRPDFHLRLLAGKQPLAPWATPYASRTTGLARFPRKIAQAAHRTSLPEVRPEQSAARPRNHARFFRLDVPVVRDDRLPSQNCHTAQQGECRLWVGWRWSRALVPGVDPDETLLATGGEDGGILALDLVFTPNPPMACWPWPARTAGCGSGRGTAAHRRRPWRRAVAWCGRWASRRMGGCWQPAPRTGGCGCGTSPGVLPRQPCWPASIRAPARSSRWFQRRRAAARGGHHQQDGHGPSTCGALGLLANSPAPSAHAARIDADRAVRARGAAARRPAATRPITLEPASLTRPAPPPARLG